MNKRTRNRLVKALREHATITLNCEPEDIDFVGNCSAHDPETDAKQEQWIREQLNSGNEWAWCYVRVTATYYGLHGTDGLGGCSYENEEAFRQPGGYFDDMVTAALEELATHLIAASNAIDILLAPKKRKR